MSAQVFVSHYQLFSEYIIFSSDLVNYGIYPRTPESHIDGAIDIFNNNLVAIGGGSNDAIMEMLINERSWLFVSNLGDFMDLSGGRYLRKFTTLVIPQNSTDLRYIFGGEYDFYNSQSNQVWLYDNITWTPITPLMRPLSGHYTTLSGENVIHYGGSYNYDGFRISKWKLENETFLRPVEFVESPGITLSKGGGSARFLSVPITHDVQQRFFSDTTWKRESEWLEWSGSSCLTATGDFQLVDRFRKCPVVIDGQNDCIGNDTENIHTTEKCSKSN